MQIVKTATPLPQATIIYSPPGVGKTELAAHYPKPIFLMTNLEVGLITLIDTGRVPADTGHFEEPARTWSELHEALMTVLNDAHGYETLVIDTLNGAQRLLKYHIIETEYDNDEAKFDAYAKGWERCLSPWVDFLGRLQAIRARRRMRVVCLAHSLVTNFRNPEGDDYQKHSPELQEKHIWNPTNAWADNVFFMDMEVNAVKEKGTNRSKGKKGKEHRQLYVEATPSHFAKNRFGLRQPISMGTSGREGFANLMKAVSATVPVRKPAPGHVNHRPPEETKQEEPISEKPQQETKPARSPVAPLTGVREGDPVPEFVSGFLKRIAACRKFGVICSLWPDIVMGYDKADDQNKIDHYPEIIKFWTTRALELAGDEKKYFESIVRRINERPDMPNAKAKALLGIDETN